jgi:hypothetical protein
VNDFEIVCWWLPDFPDGWEFTEEAGEAPNPFDALNRIEAEYCARREAWNALAWEQAENKRLRAEVEQWRGWYGRAAALFNREWAHHHGETSDIDRTKGFEIKSRFFRGPK